MKSTDTKLASLIIYDSLVRDENRLRKTMNEYLNLGSDLSLLEDQVNEMTARQERFRRSLLSSDKNNSMFR